MATFFKDGIISKGGVNQGKSVPTGVNAPGQNKDSGNAPDWLSGVPSDIKDIGQKIFDGISGGAKDFAAELRGKNLPGKAGTQIASSEASFSSSVENKDWRVKISVPQVIKNQNSPLLEMLKPNGFVFPYTPTIIISHSANYNTVAPIHNNYPFFAYQNSQVDQLTIVGQFYVQNALEAKYWMACLHFLRAMTKMDYGQGSSGAPPPIAKLNGYGDYVFNNVPVIIQNFTVDMPNEVDYISTDFTTVPGGSDPTGNTSGKSNYGWAPTESQFSLTVQPIYSRDKQTKFNYSNFITGKNLGAGYI